MVTIMSSSPARLQPRISGLYGIMLAVELAQISQPAHRQPVHVLFAGLKQRIQIVRDLGARLGAGRGGTVHQEVIGLHDAIDGGLHGVLWFQVRQVGSTAWAASNLAIAKLASLILLDSPR